VDLPEAAVSAVFETFFIIDDYTACQACVWYHDPTRHPRPSSKYKVGVGGGLRTPLCLSLVSGGISGFNVQLRVQQALIAIPSLDSTRTEYQDQDDRPFHPGHTEGGF